MEVKVWKEVSVQGELYSARTGHTVSMTDRYIYLFGGTDGQSRKNDIYQFDPIINQWDLLNPNGRPPSARCAGAGRRSAPTGPIRLRGRLRGQPVERVVFAAEDPKGGCLGSLYNLGADPRLNHEFEVRGRVLADESAALLRGFFAELR